MKRQQQGIGLLAGMTLLGVAIIIGTTVIRLLPIYLDYWTLDNIIEDVVKENTGKDVTPAALRSQLSRRFTTNRIESVSLKDIEFSSEKEGVVIDASHEKRTPLMLNVDAVVKFEEMRYVVPRS